METRLARALVILSCTAALTACAASSVTRIPESRTLARTFDLAGASSPAKDVYVAQDDGAGNGKLFEYPPQNRDDRAPLCTMTLPNFVRNIGADSSGDVYIPDIAAGVIDVHAPNCGKLLRTVRDPFGSPIGAVPFLGTLYIEGGSDVVVCPMAGCTRDLTDPSLSQLTSAAVDSVGNVWAAGYGSHGITLVVWRNAKMPGHAVSGYIRSGSPGGIQFDRFGDLFTVDTHFAQAFRFKCNTVYFFCTQLFEFALHGSSNFGAFNTLDSDVQVTDFEHESVDVYSYPDFAFEYSYDSGLKTTAAAEGIAQVP